MLFRSLLSYIGLRPEPRASRARGAVARHPATLAKRAPARTAAPSEAASEASAWRHGPPSGAASEASAWRRMERETGIEPATNSLEGCDSTTELLPPSRSLAAPFSRFGGQALSRSSASALPHASARQAVRASPPLFPRYGPAIPPTLCPAGLKSRPTYSACQHPSEVPPTDSACQRPSPPGPHPACPTAASLPLTRRQRGGRAKRALPPHKQTHHLCSRAVGTLSRARE